MIDFLFTFLAYFFPDIVSFPEPVQVLCGCFCLIFFFNAFCAIFRFVRGQ